MPINCPVIPTAQLRTIIRVYFSPVIYQYVCIKKRIYCATKHSLDRYVLPWQGGPSEKGFSAPEALRWRVIINCYMKAKERPHTSQFYALIRVWFVGAKLGILTGKTTSRWVHSKISQLSISKIAIAFKYFKRLLSYCSYVNTLLWYTRIGNIVRYTLFPARLCINRHQTWKNCRCWWASH